MYMGSRPVYMHPRISVTSWEAFPSFEQRSESMQQFWRSAPVEPLPTDWSDSGARNSSVTAVCTPVPFRSLSGWDAASWNVHVHCLLSVLHPKYFVWASTQL